MKTSVRELRPGDMQSFVDLCSTRDTLTRRDAEQRAQVVEWMAFHNPCDDGNPTYLVGAQGDRIVGHLGRMPTVFRTPGGQETASYFHDLYVHPDLRREQAQGFFLSMKMYRKAEKASKSFCAMIWTNEINISLQKARKYHQMWTDHRVLTLGLSQKIDAKVLAPAAGLTKFAARRILRAGNALNEVRLQTGALRRRVERIERFDQRFDELDQRCAATLGIAPRKDHTYLNWKYVDRPLLDEVIYQLLDESGRLAGYCVLIHPDVALSSYVAELVVVDNDPLGIQALLERTVQHLGKIGADHIYAASSTPEYSAALATRFFRRDMRIPLFLAHADRSPHASLLHQASNWHLSLGDSEGPF